MSVGTRNALQAKNGLPVALVQTFAKCAESLICALFLIIVMPLVIFGAGFVIAAIRFSEWSKIRT